MRNWIIGLFCISLCWMGGAQEPAVTIDGVSRPVKDETLSMLVAGQIKKIHVSEGMRVKEGDVLVELDRRAEDLEIARRKLLLDGKIELEAAQARVTTLTKSLAETKALYERTKSISREEVEKLELEHRLAEAEVEAAELKEQREQIEYDVALYQASLLTLHSPLSGIVTGKFREVGEVCEPYKPLLRIVDISRCYFMVHANPRVATSVKVGDKFPIEFSQIKEKVTCEGAICYISPTADPASGLIEVRLIFENPGEKIPAGIDGILSIPAR